MLVFLAVMYTIYCVQNLPRTWCRPTERRLLFPSY